MSAKQEYYREIPTHLTGGDRRDEEEIKSRKELADYRKTHKQPWYLRDNPVNQNKRKLT